MTGVELIECERERQQVKENWDDGHDDLHVGGELAMAAVTYAVPIADRVPEETWPWDAGSYRPSVDRIRELVKAGALIAAEIDRLQRLPLGRSEVEAS